MVKVLQKLLFLFFFSGILSEAFGQTIAIGTVNPGPNKAYGIGSTIAVPITIDDPDGNINALNKYQLWLSDENGNFSSKTLNIGEVTNAELFYTTFLNGIIPAKFANGINLVTSDRYRVRIVASLFSIDNTTGENIGYASPPSEPFKISVVDGVKADLESPNTAPPGNYSKTFGKCVGDPGFTYTFTNNSTPGAIVKATIRDEFNPSRSFPEWDLSSSGKSFQADLTHYTIFQTAEVNGIVGTKAYFLINNSITLPFRSISNPDQCVPVIREYTINDADLSTNFPGTIYSIDWNDGPLSKRTAAQMKRANGRIGHTYTQSSCNRVGVPGIPNSYKIELKVVSPFCGDGPDKILTGVKVLDEPKNDFTNPSFGCVGVPIEFTNRSEAQTPKTDIQGCINLSKYDWEINGVVPPNLRDLPFSTNPRITFDTPGTYTIRLIFKGTTDCTFPPPKEGTITIFAKPGVGFNVNPTNCVNTNIPITSTATNTPANATYTYTVSPSIGVTFESGTNAGNPNPVLKFSKGGIYTIKQSISVPNACSSEKEIEVIINEVPKISASWLKTAFCGSGLTLDFNNNPNNPLKTFYTGTYDDSDTYLWEIEGGSYEFINSNSQSKEPSILFKDNATYKIKITHRNNCGEDIVNKELSFVAGMRVDAGPPQSSCKGTSFELSGSVINGTITGARWTGGLGKIIPSETDPLKATYVPDPSENGPVTLKLTVSSNEESPCDEVTDDVVVTIQGPVAKFSWIKDFDCNQYSITGVTAEAAPDNASYRWFILRARETVRRAAGTGINFPSTVVNRNDSVEVILVVTSSGGCSTAEFSHTFRSIAPEINFRVKDRECTAAGLRVTFENITSSKNSFSFRWNFGNGLESTLTDPPAVTFPLGTGGVEATYQVSLAYATPPCAAATTIPDPKLLDIIVPANSPDLKIKADNTQGCGSLKVKFSAETEGATAYWWDFGDGSEGCACESPTHTYHVSNNPYTVKLTVSYANGCAKTLEMTDYIQVSPLPEANFSVLPDAIITEPNYSFTFNNSSTYKEYVKRYNWDFGDNTASNQEESPIHTFAKAGTYTVRLVVTSFTNCIDEISKEVKIVGISDTSSYPVGLYVPNAFLPNSTNPDLRSFTPKGSGLIKWQMRIFNKWGETVWETSELDANGSPVKGWDGTMNGQPVPQGVYFWEIKAKLRDGTEWPGVSYKHSAPKHVGTINLIR